MLTYDMDQRGEESLYAYLYDCMRADIENGSIAAGEKLPSKRKLADHLASSRSKVPIVSSLRKDMSNRVHAAAISLHIFQARILVP